MAVRGNSSLANGQWNLSSHHLGSATLSLHSPYNGTEEVIAADGKGLQITHSGSANLPSPTRSLILDDVLQVACAAKDQVSVNKFCTDNDVYMEFFPNKFQVKGLTSGVYVLVGKSKNGGYEWPCRAPDPDFSKPSLLSS